MSERIYNQFDLETIAALADIVKEKDLGEITIIDGGKQITVKGKKCPPPPPMNMAMPPMQHDMMPVTMNAAAKDSAGSPDIPHASDGNIVKSPIVGTFYASPSPDKAPFVSVGSRVKKGDIIMIIESMKLMNEIQSPYDGTVSEILVKNGDSVEYDQPVMVIK